MPDQPSLASRRCEPCRRGVPPLTKTERNRLLAQVPDWTLRDGIRIERRITCKTFAGALALVNRIAALAEAEGHHPDVSFGWGYVAVSLSTHAIKGLHANDFIVAAKLDNLFQIEIEKS